jgi:molybdate transport system ATP-binding protein
MDEIKNCTSPAVSTPDIYEKASVDSLDNKSKFMSIDILKSHADFQLQISNLKIPVAGVTAVFGPSGSGKTTFLRCLAGFENFTGRLIMKGIVWQNEKNILKTHLRPIGYVFQDASLFTHLNVEKNLRYAYERIFEIQRKLTWEQIVKLLNLQPLLKRNVQMLSGGEKQRVAIGRALLTSPELLLMDEPLSALDVKSKNEILVYLKKISEELHIPILYVSHSLDEVIKIADRLLLLENGKMIRLGPVEDLLCELDLSVLQGDLSSALLYGVFDHEESEFGIACILCEGQKIYLPRPEITKTERVRIKISAKDVSLTKVLPTATSILNILQGQVCEIKMLDQFQVLVKIKLGQQFLLSRITKKSLFNLKLNVGDVLFVQIKSVGLVS